MGNNISNNIKGFTLVELVVVLAIVAILLALSIPMYASWQKRTQVKKDIYMIYSLLNKARVRAFVTKTGCGVKIINSKEFQLSCGGFTSSITKTITPFDYGFSGGVNYVAFGPDGIADIVGRIYSTVLENKPFTCVSVSNLRIAIGKWNGNKCIVEE